MKPLAIAIATLAAAATPYAFAQQDTTDLYRSGRPLSHGYNDSNSPDDIRRDELRDQYIQGEVWREDVRRGDWRRNTGRVLEKRAVYDRASAREECWNAGTRRYEERHEGNVGAGAALGALLGGVLGHQVDSGAGTAAGAVLGGLAGHYIQKNRHDDDRVDAINCRPVAGTGNIVGYEVKYDYNGREYVTRLRDDPRRRLRPGQEIRADGTPWDNQYAYNWR